MAGVTNHRQEALKTLAIEMATMGKNSLHDYIYRPNSYITFDPLRQTSFLLFNSQITEELFKLSKSLRQIDQDRFYKLHRKRLASEFLKIGLQFEWTYFLRDEVRKMILEEKNSPLYDSPESIYPVIEDDIFVNECLLSDLLNEFIYLKKKTFRQGQAERLEKYIIEEVTIFGHYLTETFNAD